MTNDKLLKELRKRLQANIKTDWNDPHNEGWDENSPKAGFRALLELIEEEWTEGLTPPCGLHEQRVDDEALGRVMMESIEEDCSWYGQGEDIQNTYQSAVEGAHKDQADAADLMLIAVCGYGIESLRAIVKGRGAKIES